MIVDEQLHSEKNNLIWTKWKRVLTLIFNEMFWRVVIKSSHQNDCRKIIFTVQLQKQTALSQLSILNFNQENMIVFNEEKQLNQEKEKDEKKKIAKFNDEDLKYSNNSVTDSSDDAELQRSRSVSLLSDSDEILQDLMKDDDSNFLIMKNKCMSRHLYSV